MYVRDPEKRKADLLAAKDLLDWSWEQMGGAVGVTGNTVRGWARGQGVARLARPAYDRLLRIAEKKAALATTTAPAAPGKAGP